MLTVSEVMQAAQHAAGAATKVSNRSREVEQDAELKVSVAFANGDTDRGPVKVRTAVLFDEPEIVVSYDKREVRFTVDRLDPASPRWVAAGPAGTTVVHGAGDVVRAIEAAGLSLATRGLAAGCGGDSAGPSRPEAPVD
jgi:hypothetical protein